MRLPTAATNHQAPNTDLGARPVVNGDSPVLQAKIAVANVANSLQAAIATSVNNKLVLVLVLVLLQGVALDNNNLVLVLREVVALDNNNLVLVLREVVALGALAEVSNNNHSRQAVLLATVLVNVLAADNKLLQEAVLLLVLVVRNRQVVVRFLVPSRAKAAVAHLAWAALEVTLATEDASVERTALKPHVEFRLPARLTQPLAMVDQLRARMRHMQA